MFLLLTILFFVAFCQESYGAWGLIYLYEEKCIDDVEVAVYLSPDCIYLEEKKVSFRYACSLKTMNISVEVYNDEKCTDLLQSVPVFEIHKCVQADRVHLKYECTEEFKLNYPHQAFSVGLKPNQTDIGKLDDPVIEQMIFPIKKCFKYPGGLFKGNRVTTTCDADTGVGELEIYETPACLIPREKIEMKPGQIIDISEYVVEEGKVYWKYDGCKTS